MSATRRRAAPARGVSRRALLGAGLLCGALRGVSGATATGSLPAARSLRDELALALKAGQPLVALVSLDGCPFCKIAREHYLSPLRAQEGLPVVQVDMRSALPVQDFLGVTLTHDALLRAWRVAVAPTVLFFGPGGRELAPRLVGFGSPDYYGALLDDRLIQARVAIRSP